MKGTEGVRGIFVVCSEVGKGDIRVGWEIKGREGVEGLRGTGCGETGKE